MIVMHTSCNYVVGMQGLEYPSYNSHSNQPSLTPMFEIGIALRAAHKLLVLHVFCYVVNVGFLKGYKYV